MIGTRTPFRVSFVGGGSDMREFYTRHPGCVVSTTINKYMYIFIHPFFDNKIQVKYSKTELVESVDQIKHPIVRELLKRFHIHGIDINSIADIPAGTGLGSSSSYTVGLTHALYAYIGKYFSKEKLAQKACELEIDILKEPIGKQDQYAVSYGGLNCITFYSNGSVGVEPIVMRRERFFALEENLLMFYLGTTRNAREILSDQRDKLVTDDDRFQRLVRMAQLAQQLRVCLLDGNPDDMGLILDENWHLKKELSSRISDERIDGYYRIARENGALGGKLLGAGGGGFLLFYCPKEDQDKLRAALSDLREMPFRFDYFGTKIIYVSEHYGGPADG